MTPSFATSNALSSNHRSAKKRNTTFSTNLFGCPNQPQVTGDGRLGEERGCLSCIRDGFQWFQPRPAGCLGADPQCLIGEVGEAMRLDSRHRPASRRDDGASRRSRLRPALRQRRTRGIRHRLLILIRDGHHQRLADEAGGRQGLSNMQ